MTTQKDAFADRRQQMVETQLRTHGISDQAVLRAMLEVPRHLFVPNYLRPFAYSDRPLSIGMGQTISQPFIVAFMAQALKLTPRSIVLEIGTGSGYGAAVLSRLVCRVFTVERHRDLAEGARKTLERLGYDNISIGARNGSRGWPEKAPFDGIVVTAAASKTPPSLLDQLSPGGRLIIPVGYPHSQNLIRIELEPDGTISRKTLLPVRFVPLVCEDEES